VKIRNTFLLLVSHGVAVAAGAIYSGELTRRSTQVSSYGARLLVSSSLQPSTSHSSCDA